MYNFPYIVNICYIINKKGEVLLQKKARGFGKGKWNGSGGKKEEDETIEESVIREIKEETNIKINNFEKVGEIEFVFTENNDSNNYTHVYLCKEWEGKPKDGGEGELRWYKFNEIPLDKMWDDDKYWLPSVLKGEKVHMRFFFDEYSKVIKKEILS
jgi:mutator protein MutT